MTYHTRGHSTRGSSPSAYDSTQTCQRSGNRIRRGDSLACEHGADLPLANSPAIAEFCAETGRSLWSAVRQHRCCRAGELRRRPIMSPRRVGSTSPASQSGTDAPHSTAAAPHLHAPALVAPFSRPAKINIHTFARGSQPRLTISLTGYIIYSVSVSVSRNAQEGLLLRLSLRLAGSPGSTATASAARRS